MEINSSTGLREYSLRGSYRKILHQPQDVSWQIMQYTDPDVGLTQADEDVLLGYEKAKEDNEGMFRALQIRFTLGTAAYATMALRELLKTETGSQHQASLTQKAEDRHFRGVRSNG
jgi:tRNA pseudouridine13 synthase